MDASEILILANATLALIGTAVALSRPLQKLLSARSPKLKFAFKNRYAIAIILTIVMITSVSAVTLFQHTFPATPSGSSQAITSTCTTLTLETTGMITGLPESMLFNCGLTTGATSLSLVSHVNSATVCTGGSPLTSGTGHGFTASDSLDYCLASNSYPSGGISSFTVTWSQ